MNHYGINRFIEALVSIYNEIEEIKNGVADADDNVLKNAPHTAQALIADDWNHAYSRNKAAYPLPWVKEINFSLR